MTPEQSAQLKDFLKLLGAEMAAQLIPVIVQAANPNATVSVLERDGESPPKQKATTLPQQIQDLIDIIKTQNKIALYQLDVVEQDELKRHRRRKKNG